MSAALNHPLPVCPCRLLPPHAAVATLLLSPAPKRKSFSRLPQPDPKNPRGERRKNIAPPPAADRSSCLPPSIRASGSGSPCESASPTFEPRQGAATARSFGVYPVVGTE